MTSTRIIFADEYESAKKETEKLIKARNRAAACIEDAKARYIKEKTRARSKKAALERDAVLQSKRFDALADYERREDIVEMYGWGSITQSQCDKLEALWDERETLKNATTNGGVYSDLVTEILDDAYLCALKAHEDKIEEFEAMEATHKKQKQELDEELRKRDEQYLALKYGWE